MSAEAFLPFSRPFISESAIQEVVDCLRSGWLATGPRVQQFTGDLERYLGAPYVLPLTSATAGLHLSLLAMGLRPGDEVITTPLTFAATLNTIVLAGGTPVLVDIDPNTLNLDLNRVEAAITKRTRVIMPVHFAGLPVDCDALYALAARHGLRVLEDAAHAIGATYRDARIGSFGDTQVFSFHPTKNLTTGEGGCITTRDPDLLAVAQRLCFHGMDRQAFNRYGKTGSQDYEIVAPGYKFNMSDIQAALGIHQLQALEDFLARRQALAMRYQAALADFPQWSLPGLPDYAHRHAWHIYTPLLNPDEAHMNREQFIQAMKNENIGIGLHYRVVHLYPYYRETFSFAPGDFPIAESVGERIVSLPLFPGMTNLEQDRVLETMYRLFNEVRV